MGATSDKIQGQGKQAAGIVTGDQDLEAEGKADRQVGEAEEKLDAAKEKFEDAKDKAAELAEKAKDKLPGNN
ncbi:MAG TPA: CsbD family protein [Dermatophilaceae bacterium]|nr:CsbD family protein [Dermatophilaceae bacterium]